MKENGFGSMGWKLNGRSGDRDGIIQGQIRTVLQFTMVCGMRNIAQMIIDLCASLQVAGKYYLEGRNLRGNDACTLSRISRALIFAVLNFKIFRVN